MWQDAPVGAGTTGRLQGKRALVTAAGAGIGRACALAFAREGAQVTATDIDEGALPALAAHGVAATARLDVRDTGAVAALAEKLGPIDILLNAAGFVHHGTVFDCSEADWDFSFDLNVKSMHRMITAFLPAMLAHGGGAIVNIASVVGARKAAPNRYVYAATKAAIVGLTKAVAIDFVTRGIRCNCICPGTIDTPSLDGRINALGGNARAQFVARQPLGRLGTPDEVAAVAVHLAGDESAFTTGCAYVVDGGFTL
jgi:2-keto-3-deoxy-L-fuconate dehydrogenase